MLEVLPESQGNVMGVRPAIFQPASREGEPRSQAGAQPGRARQDATRPGVDLRRQSRDNSG
ncbi:MAG: hypothetical protein A2Z73_06280 [Deltaproteobacteria bacterium RBG_13_60_28]|nr:MAG: hypothetical protein A2Z73_06280 [Deltaproteobacteria bacterium RBG_13_60_28]